MASNGYPAIASHFIPTASSNPSNVAFNCLNHNSSNTQSSHSSSVHGYPSPSIPIERPSPRKVLHPPPFRTSPQLTPAALPSLSASATSSTIPTTSSVSMSQPSSLFVPPFPFPQIWRDMYADTWAQSLMPTPQHNNPPSIYGMRPDRGLA